MSEMISDRYHYANPNVRPYVGLNHFSCASSALHIAYRAFGLNYPEHEIIRDFRQDLREGVNWTKMMDHAESLGFKADFFAELDYESLLAPLYQIPYVLIVGWIAINHTVYKLHHCSPVRYISQDKIALTNTGDHRLEKFEREEFIPLWHDYNHEHPFMTMRRETV